jgi:hypothetical protein
MIPQKGKGATTRRPMPTLAELRTDLPDDQGNVTIKASALDPNSPSQWGPLEEQRTSLQTLEATRLGRTRRVYLIERSACRPWVKRRHR